MTKLSFYNGLREIGGTFVVVETDTTKCMFDFGFSAANRMDAKVVQRDDYAADYVRLGMLASADGIYEKPTADKCGLLPYEEERKQVFFVISHMHIDHMGGLGCLHPDVPVYMSTDSLRLYRRLAVMGEAEHREHKNCIGVDYGETFTVGDITVKVVQIDHDVIGACGYLIQTADGNVCYTGDYRFHGFHPEITRKFAETMHGADVMITEGVTVSFGEIDMLSLEEPEQAPRTEEDLQKELHEIGIEDTGLLVVNFYNRNVERIHRMIHTCIRSGRSLVLEPIAADYVHEFYPEDEILVYGEIAAEDCPFKKVSRADILAAPQRYVLQQDYSHIYESIELAPVISRYIHMDGAPLGDYDPSFAKLKEFLTVMNIPYDYRGLGGHSKPYYLRTMIDAIAPKILIPLHSYKPENVQSKMAGKRILPEYGDEMFLEHGDIKRLMRRV